MRIKSDQVLQMISWIRHANKLGQVHIIVQLYSVHCLVFVWMVYFEFRQCLFICDGVFDICDGMFGIMF